LYHSVYFFAMALQHRAVKRLFSAAFQVRTYSAPADRSIPVAKQKYIPTEGTYPKGFLAGAAHAGVKTSNISYDDIALVVSEQPCNAAAVFTRNKFQAAPITVSQRVLAANRKEGVGIRGVVVNSGCANAITGAQGLASATEMGLAADACFGADASRHKARDSGKQSQDFDPTPETLVMSTGVIGQQLPIAKITSAIPKAHAALGSTHEHWMRAAQAICTTDTFPKLLSRTFTLPSHPNTTYSIAGLAKGAGMIHPNMGTLLAILCTDAKIDQSPLTVLRACTNQSFNRISIDGDTSTNDTVALLANGAAAPGTPSLHFPRRGQGPWGEDAVAFYEALRALMTDLAKLVVRDGEGATKFVTIRVRSDVSKATANRVAKSIAMSSLVKTALYGKDANWGRILCAIGYAPGVINDPHAGIRADQFTNKNGELRQVEQVELNKTSVSFIPSDGSAELKLLVRGEPEQVDEARAKEILEMEDLEISVRLEDDGRSSLSNEVFREGQKTWESVFWTCDFSHEYVTINGDYRT
jgi:glutamate N-acetyltransferase/amino-acid N-acetyltransferase